MVIDRETFIDLATYLEAASEEHLDLTRTLMEFADSGCTAESHDFTGVINHLVGLSGALVGIEQLLRALLDANKAENVSHREKPNA